MFYYTGLQDKVQCTYCGGILSDWDFGDVVHLEHKRHFPDCPWIRQCQLQPELIANAGINPTPPPPSHPSQGDKCKCFYCGGILYDWEPNDDIWEEHAKWFPECPYLKLQKGDNFIQDVQRNQSGVPDSSSTGTAYQLSVTNGCLFLFLGASQTPSETVPKTVEEPSTSQGHPSAAAGSSISSGASASKSDQIAKTVTSVTSLAESEQKDVKTILEENENLKKQKECKICMSDDATTVFLPCGHLVCCPGCAVSVKDCPMCRKAIEKVVRVYY
ncbi:hypothetical protein KUTeg_004829 [Tegillarca granosa]|uniref:RING-type domain-containing protein n=1 Tax=Tegillarca granosa TaxID=220873 RepID=A0ABQ9FI00_TEGGR|nr:hypothetical protein KUTeg_004829 [Tegillarca granosa]